MNFLDYEFQVVDLIKAASFYSNNKELIGEMVSTESNSIHPSKEDMGFPNQWKPMHWKWFLKLDGHIIFSGDV